MKVKGSAKGPINPSSLPANVEYVLSGKIKLSLSLNDFRDSLSNLPEFTNTSDFYLLSGFLKRPESDGVRKKYFKQIR